MTSDYATVQENREKVQARVTEFYPAATKETTRISLTIDRFVLGPVYYVEWEDKQADDQDCFCYALVHKEVEIYDDGVQLVQRMKQILDERKTLFQHIGEFTFNELIGALIAVVLTVVFCVTLRDTTPPPNVNKEFLGLVMLIAGYYFGKGK
jgi:hypothetical protein